MSADTIPTSKAAGVQSLLLIGVLAVMSEGFLPIGRFLGLTDVLEPGVGDPYANALQCLVLMVVLTAAFVHRRHVLPLCRAASCLFIPWIYCTASAIWSDNPGTTLRHALLLLAFLLFAPLAIALRGIDGTMRLMRTTSLVLLVCSLVTYVALPDVGGDVGEYAGALRGVFVQKNVAAWAFELALAYVGYGVLARRRFRVADVVTITLFAGAIILTRSTTELLSACLLTGYWIFVLWYRGARTRLLPVALAGGAVGTLALAIVLLGADSFSLIGKDPTLTGRDVIWYVARTLIRARPLLGYGYQGFWLSGDRTVEQAWAEIGWDAPHAHNGLLELLVEQGFVGAILAAVVLRRLVVDSARAIRRNGSPLGCWTLSIVLLTAIKSLTEQVWFMLDVSTMLLSFCLVGLAVENAAAARQPRRVAASPSAAASAARIGFGWNAAS